MCLHFPACACVGKCQGLVSPQSQYARGIDPNRRTTRPVSRAAAKHHRMPCPYCGELMNVDSEKRYPTVDHILPRRLKGQSWAGNTLRACRQCNHDKGSRLISDWHRLLVLSEDDRAPFVADVIARLRSGQLVE